MQEKQKDVAIVAVATLHKDILPSLRVRRSQRGPSPARSRPWSCHRTQIWRRRTPLLVLCLFAVLEWWEERGELRWLCPVPVWMRVKSGINNRGRSSVRYKTVVGRQRLISSLLVFYETIWDFMCIASYKIGFPKTLKLPDKMWR